MLPGGRHALRDPTPQGGAKMAPLLNRDSDGRSSETWRSSP